MMNVKPLSYRISRRQRAFNGRVYNGNETTTVSTGNACFDRPATRLRILFTDIVSIHVTTCVFTVGGVGTLLIFVLLGSIGVAGQGGIDDMHDTSFSMFPTQGIYIPGKERLTHQSAESLSHMGEEDEDDALQQRISSMGLYGAKYRNSSFPYNYSSYPPLNYYQNPMQYKLEPTVDTLLHTPRDKLLLSLNGSDDENVKTISTKYRSSHPGRNVININFVPNMKNSQEEDNSSEDFKAIFSNGNKRLPSITDPPTPNKTSAFGTGRDGSMRTKLHSLETPQNVRHYRKKNPNKEKYSDESREEKRTDEVIGSHKTKHFSFPIAAQNPHLEDPSDIFDYDDYDTVERFIPGNVSHTSGKLRFRQGSQAEVDGIESENSVRSRKRPRRSVVHLYDMVVCSTGCNPLIFKGYGCYCGFLGSGLTVDGIDKCCAKHDWCYHHAKCPPLLTYFVPYYWRCDHGRPQCVSDFRGWKGICGAHLCECDRQFAECLKKFPCPRSRAMCVTSPWSHTTADARTHPSSTLSRRLKFWKQPVAPPPPPLLPPSPFTGLPPFLPFPPIGIPFP